ncbi:hypothetical protein C8Q70DRAFT_1036957 [Cubamyces menziesii]|nr:hypothetical protein C8Q70DRAFT_1036957 [Cubamyces menziesii]
MEGRFERPDDVSYVFEVTRVRCRFTQHFCIIGSSALLWFDFIITLPTEYRRIWQRPLAGVTLVYCGLRHVAVTERIFLLLETFVWSSSDNTCGVFTRMSDVLLILNSLAFSVFVCLRIYGIWGREWKPLLIVLPLCLVKPILGIYETASYTAIQTGFPFGCIRAYNLTESVILKCSYTSSAIPIITEVVVVVLTWIKTFGIIRDSRLGSVVAQLPTLIPGGVLLGVRTVHGTY